MNYASKSNNVIKSEAMGNEKRIIKIAKTWTWMDID